MKLRLTSFALLIALVSTFTLAPMAASAAPKDRNFLKNLPASGALSDGGDFTGQLTITKVGYDSAKGFVVDGVLTGTAQSVDGEATAISQTFTSVATTLNETSSAPASAFQTQAVCDILFLDLGPLNLDVLGLTVDLSEIVLDINAVSGAGNLLGNLLCGVAGLLDAGGFLSNLITGLNQLTAFLDRINNLLG